MRFYGTPAEEAVGGKAYMARDGVFKDVDVALAWHPADRTRADMQGGQAIVDMLVEFKGQAAHAAADPWNGRSAVDAVELFTHAVNLMREHVRAHDAHALRDHGRRRRAERRARDSAACGSGRATSTAPCSTASSSGCGARSQGAALAAGVEGKVTVQAGDLEILINETGARMLDANLRWLGPIRYTPEEEAFARALQTASGRRGARDGRRRSCSLEGQEQEGGSTDVGDVSWVTPTLHVSVATAPRGVPWHAWPVVAAGGMSIGHKGMLLAAQTLAATMVDLFEDPAARAAVRAGVREEDPGLRLPALHPRRPAAAAEVGVTRRPRPVSPGCPWLPERARLYRGSRP